MENTLLFEGLEELLNEGIGTGFFLHEIQRRLRGVPVYTKSNSPEFHRNIKNLLNENLKRGYRIPIVDKNVILNIMTMLGVKIPDYTKIDYNIAYMIVDVSLTTSLPVLFIIEPKERNIVCMLTLLEQDTKLLIRFIGVNSAMSEKEINSHMDDISKALSKALE